jgi:Uma2 family endonuclease
MATTATMTGAQFDALPYEEGRRWELVGAELIAMPSPTPEHQMIVQRIMFELVLYLRNRQDEGIIALADIEFALDRDYRVRPDVLVLTGDRARSLDWNKVPIAGAPDIAVEVISPSERAFESQQKVQAYLQYGSKEVWQFYPKSRTVVVHKAGMSRTFSSGEEITTELLADFSLKLAQVF